MTALTESIDIGVVIKPGDIIAYKVLAGKKIFRGSLCKIKGNGYLDTMAAEATAIFAGVSLQEVDNDGGASGAKTCNTQTRGSQEFATAGMAVANIGDKVYASDDQTVSSTKGSNEMYIGKIVDVMSATRVQVLYDVATNE